MRALAARNTGRPLLFHGPQQFGPPHRPSYSLSVVPDRSLTTLRKVLRWAARMSLCAYTYVQVKVEDNYWDPLLGSWSAPRFVTRFTSVAELPLSSAKNFKWAWLARLRAAQIETESTSPRGLFNFVVCWNNPNGGIWVLDDASNKWCLCLVSHSGRGGHSGPKPVEQIVCDVFLWSTMLADLRSFVRAYLQSLSTMKRGKELRLYGSIR